MKGPGANRFEMRPIPASLGAVNATTSMQCLIDDLYLPSARASGAVLAEFVYNTYGGRWGPFTS
jgi:hypothetical protein